ncbi:MAG: hypothetical protein IPO30_20020 [Hyphomonadaceae bacterium]|nr:hypothetical protein [Hyphomonadaceae bacterium]
MQFFWPGRLNLEPTALTRFGRVLHWIGCGFFMIVGIAVLIGIALGVYQFATNAVGYYGDPLAPGTLIGSASAFIAALLIYLGSRALRYIFSGE